MANVYVFSKLPKGHEFILPQADPVTIKGGDLVNGSYAMTEVDASLWDAVKNVHKDSPLLKSGVIFDAASGFKGADQAREKQGDVRHGLEQVNPGQTRSKPDGKSK